MSETLPSLPPGGPAHPLSSPTGSMPTASSSASLPDPTDTPASQITLKGWDRAKVDARDIAMVEKSLALRAHVLDVSSRQLAASLDIDKKAAVRLATVDLFVEKAQRVLTRRAHALYFSGFVCSLFAVAMLATAIWIAFERSGNTGSNPLSTERLVLTIFQTLALGAFIYVTVKWFIQLARSFFHEALNLYERRHALRFGRMWMYMSGDDPDLDTLTMAFEWNRTSVKSFLDIDATKVTRTLFHEVTDAIAKVPSETAQAVAAVVKKSPPGAP